MYKQLNMRDPATVNCRIYIGNLDDSVTPEKLEEHFKQHGKVRGVNLQRGFGFIQFDEPAGALTSIQKEHGIMFHGRKLNVKQAMDKNNKNQQMPQQQQQQQHQNKPSLLSQQHQNKPQMGQQHQNKLPMLTQQHQNNPQQQHQNQPQQQLHQNQPLLLLQQQQQKLQIEDKPGPLMNIMDKSTMNGPPRKLRRGRGGSRVGMDRDMSPGGDDYSYSRETPPFYGRDDNFQNKPSIAPPPVVMPQGNRGATSSERNDCEIIVVSKALTEYAEYIEHRLKSIGLVVDLLFPNEDVPIGRVLANISSRGCLYAVLIMPQNEEHRSLTLNILHGIPQEHRNMPVDDAVALISRNFDAYKRGEKSIQSKTSIGTAAMATERHPEAIQILLNLLADNRQLTTLQYDRIIKYLQERRELQYKQEIGDSADLDKDFTKEAELQNRIMSILNNPGAAVAVEAPAITSSPANQNSAPILNDPSVQKALDSLLQGDILKNMSGSGRY